MNNNNREFSLKVYSYDGPVITIENETKLCQYRNIISSHIRDSGGTVENYYTVRFLDSSTLYAFISWLTNFLANIKQI